MSKLLGGSTSVRIRRCALILLDLALLYIAIELAVVFRYDGAISQTMRVRLDRRIPLLIVFYTGALMAGGVYHMMWRYAGARELFRLMFLCAAATAVVLICNRVFAWKMNCVTPSASVFAPLTYCVVPLFNVSSPVSRLCAPDARLLTPDVICAELAFSVATPSV